MADREPGERAEPAAEPLGSPYLAALLAWLLPGAGHLYLRRRGRALAFCALVLAGVAVGCALHGRLYSSLRGQPLAVLATVAEIGLGAVYALLRFALRYEGDLVAPGFEYGTAFLLTAALMNLLLILDAWDIAQGKKQ